MSCWYCPDVVIISVKVLTAILSFSTSQSSSVCHIKLRRMGRLCSLFLPDSTKIILINLEFCIRFTTSSLYLKPCIYLFQLVFFVFQVRFRLMGACHFAKTFSVPSRKSTACTTKRLSTFWSFWPLNLVRMTWLWRGTGGLDYGDV